MTLANIVDLTYIRNATGRQGKIEPSLLELDKEESHLHTGSKVQRRGKMNVLWIVNTNTFLLILLIIMVSYLTTQVTALIRWLKRE